MSDGQSDGLRSQEDQAQGFPRLADLPPPLDFGPAVQHIDRPVGPVMIGGRAGFIPHDLGRLTIEEIAWRLAGLPRWAGNGSPYSVAQHCISVAKALPPSVQHKTDAQRWALFHDVAEVFMGDIAGPFHERFYWRTENGPVPLSEMERALSFAVLRLFTRDKMHPAQFLDVALDVGQCDKLEAIREAVRLFGVVEGARLFPQVADGHIVEIAEGPPLAVMSEATAASEFIRMARALGLRNPQEEKEKPHATNDDP